LHERDHIYFELLKQKIVAMMQQSYPAINSNIGAWKGQEITDFQEDLRIKVNANISEKWFYTHMKSSHATLPRIDMLNFLSKYAGYANWDDFVFKNKMPLQVLTSTKNPNRYFILIPLLALVIVCLFFGLFKLFNTREYRFTFIDADTHEPITNNQTDVILLNEGESPVHSLVGNDGYFRLKTDKSRIRMVVISPYYQVDTLVRIVTKLNRDEIIMLKPDDYALMIHYFSMMKVDDWEKRRNRLNTMIDDEAMICQVFTGKETTGMALYNKQEFIDKLTTPSGSLKNIEILELKTRNSRIMVLRFRINENKR
jgi:hypothetical protein